MARDDGVGHGLGGQVGAAHQERLDGWRAVAVGGQFDLGRVLGDDGVAVGLQVLGVGLGDRRQARPRQVEAVGGGEVLGGVERPDVEIERPSVARSQDAGDGERHRIGIRHGEGQPGRA